MNTPENEWPKDWEPQPSVKTIGNVWPKDWKKIEHEKPYLLEQCRGYRGQVCDYEIGHGQLLARFYAPRPVADTLLYCVGCDVVRFHAYWDDVDVRVALSRDKWGQRFTITDGERLYIECRTAELAESRDGVSYIPRWFEEA
jgi:hypothetical protein